MDDLFYTISSFVYLSKSIGEIKMELQSSNAQSGSKSAIFVRCDLEMWQMTLRNNRSPLLSCFNLSTSFHSHQWIQTGVKSPETFNSVQNGWFFVPCDLEIWQMTLKNNRALVLCCFKLCVSFQSHLWIQTGVTVRKRSFGSTLAIFLSSVTLNFDGWPWRTIEYLFYATFSFVHHFVAISEFKLELQSRNAQFW